MTRPLVLAFCLLSAACASHIPGLRSSEYSATDPLSGLFDLKSKEETQASGAIWPASDGPIMIEIEEFDSPTVDALKELLPELEAAGHQELTIRIDSYGGSVHWGMEMIQLLENSGLYVQCVVDTKAMSMGFFLLESCNERLMTKRSTLMAHEPWTKTQGHATDLEDTAKRLRVLTNSMVEIAVEKMKISKEEFLRRIDAKEWHMGWEEAMEVGAIDGTISVSELPRQYNMQIKQLSLLDLLTGGSKK